MKNLILKIILPLVVVGGIAAGAMYAAVYFENKKLEELAKNNPSGQEYLNQLREEKKKLWDADAKNDAEAKFNIAVIKNILGDKDGALKDYLAILKTDEKNVKVLNNIADIYQDKTEWQKAEEYYEKLLATDPQFVPAYRNLANLYRYRFENSEEKIKELIDRGLGQTNDNPELLGWIISYYQETGQNEKSPPYSQKLVEQLRQMEK